MVRVNANTFTLLNLMMTTITPAAAALKQIKILHIDWHHTLEIEVSEDTTWGAILEIAYQGFPEDTKPYWPKFNITKYVLVYMNTRLNLNEACGTVSITSVLYNIMPYQLAGD